MSMIKKMSFDGLACRIKDLSTHRDYQDWDTGTVDLVGTFLLLPISLAAPILAVAP